MRSPATPRLDLPLRNAAFVLIALLPTGASATFAEQCELKLGRGLLTTEIQSTEQGRAFPLRVAYAGREVVFAAARGNVYSGEPGRLRIDVADPQRRHVFQLTAVDGKDCTEAAQSGSTCYTVTQARVVFGATAGRPRIASTTRRGVLSCSVG
ncbi:MAG: hypothetical protein EOP81_14300 [Variovorax sp.]|nr:MAG: hypothetical protein EOP81_14300 [Variovorax sp.]